MPARVKIALFARKLVLIFCYCAFRYLHLFPTNLGGSACSSEIVQAISADRHFGGHSGMIRHNCRNWLHFYRIPCRLSILVGKKVYMYYVGTDNYFADRWRLRLTIVNNPSPYNDEPHNGRIVAPYAGHFETAAQFAVFYGRRSSAHHYPSHQIRL